MVMWRIAIARACRRGMAVSRPVGAGMVIRELVESVSWLDPQDVWAGLASVACALGCERRIGDKIRVQVRYFISSLGGSARQVLRAVRCHWGIENRLHWVLDVQFGEDACRIRKDNAPQNLATLRHLSLNLLRQERGAKVGIKNRRHRAGWDNAYLEKVLAG